MENNEHCGEEKNVYNEHLEEEQHNEGIETHDTKQLLRQTFQNTLNSSNSSNFCPSFMAYNGDSVTSTNGEESEALGMSRQIMGSYRTPDGGFKKRGKGRRGSIYERIWTENEIKSLINLWKANEVLYNSNHQYYFDKQLKEETINNIANELDIHAEAVTKKLASLRSYYSQLRTNFKKRQVGNNRAEVQQPTWVFYTSLYFLEPHITCKSVPENAISRESPFHDVSKKRKIEKAREEMLPIFERSENSQFGQRNIESPAPMKEVCSRTFTEENDDDFFGQLIAKSLYKFPDGEVKDDLKIEIQKVINQAKRKLR